MLLPISSRVVRCFISNGNLPSTLGLARGKGKDRTKSRRGPEYHHRMESLDPPLSLVGSPASDAKDVRAIRSLEVLEAGTRGYACLFEAIGEVIQVGFSTLLALICVVKMRRYY